MSSKIELKIPGYGTLIADAETPDIGGHYAIYLGFIAENGSHRDIACLRDEDADLSGDLELKVWGDPQSEDPTDTYLFDENELKED